MPGSVITPLATALDWVVASPILSTTLVATVYFLYKILHLLVISPWRSQLEVLGGPPKPGKFFDMTDLRSALESVFSLAFNLIHRLETETNETSPPLEKVHK